MVHGGRSTEKKYLNRRRGSCWEEKIQFSILNSLPRAPDTKPRLKRCLYQQRRNESRRTSNALNVDTILVSQHVLHLRHPRSPSFSQEFHIFPSKTAIDLLHWGSQKTKTPCPLGPTSIHVNITREKKTHTPGNTAVRGISQEQPFLLAFDTKKTIQFALLPVYTLPSKKLCWLLDIMKKPQPVNFDLIESSRPEYASWHDTRGMWKRP